MSEHPQRVCVQGLGFVGAAMAAAIAQARDEEGQACFDVIGVDLPTPLGQERVSALNAGRFPFETADNDLVAAVAAGHAAGNLRATTDPEVYATADVIVVDVHLDVATGGDRPRIAMEGFVAAIDTLGKVIRPDALVLIETTVPPGTTRLVAKPRLEAQLEARGLPADQLRVAHAYERVMPGADYLASIVSFWRVYAGVDQPSAEAAEAFLSKVIDIERFPLTRLDDTTASETAKVLENSYRAVTIAFMEEWGRFAEAVGIDLYPVIDAIRVRPTHNNIRQPGFGVGGYCLTKDPLFPGLAAKELWNLDIDFPFSKEAVRVNAQMPLVTLQRLHEQLGGLADKRILLLGISYRQDVADTRYSPSEPFYREARERGAEVVAHDPLVRHWEELGVDVPDALPPAEGFDAVVFAVPHRAYVNLDVDAWLGAANPLVFDANRVLSPAQLEQLRTRGGRFASIGRGETK